MKIGVGVCGEFWIGMKSVEGMGLCIVIGIMGSMGLEKAETSMNEFFLGRANNVGPGCR